MIYKSTLGEWSMLRQRLGDFCSVVCMKAIITGIEETLGERATAIALTAAGRVRGKALIAELGISETDLSLDDLVSQLDRALGRDGTRLCIIDKIERAGNVIKVYTLETVCSAGEPEGSNRKCTYTLGAVWGALEQILGKHLQGKHTESVLRGGSHDIFVFTAIPS
jgi:predicted hydrocarbon binding protein